jgi:hypothetical protein
MFRPFVVVLRLTRRKKRLSAAPGSDRYRMAETGSSLGDARAASSPVRRALDTRY